MSIDNFTASLIEMAEAVKAKPELEARIEKLEQDRDFFERHLRSEENTSSSLRHTIEVLQAQLSEARRERDEAFFRNLELEELKDKVGGLVGQALELFKSSSPEPTQPVTVAEPEPFTDAHPVWKPISEVQPEAKPADTSIWPAGPIDPVVVEPQGQSAVPLSSTVVPGDVGQPESDGMTSKAGTEPTQIQSEPDGWERGKPYSYKPWYMTDSEWVSRGGFGPDLAPPMADPSPF